MSAAPRRELATSVPDAASNRILARWLLGLRWAVFLFLAATLPLCDRLFGFHVRYAVAAPVIALMLLFNAATGRRLAAAGDVSTRALALGAAADLVAIGAVLAASGGAANPFSAVFFVHVALAASLLPARTTFALAGLSACLFAALFALPTEACCPNHPANGAFSTHLYGMWLGYVVAAGLVAYFLTRVRRALDERGREIARLRKEAEDNARFAALGTLAAGTAHELATPLGTIAVLAGEIPNADAAEAGEHAAAIGREVSRCREILTKMQAGPAAPPPPAQGVEIGAAVRRAVETWRRAHPAAAVTLDERLDARAPARVTLSAEDVEATICALLDNALHATRATGAVDHEPIAIRLGHEDGAVVVRVEDGGTGVAPHLAGRIGEPFLTTKEPGEGMGLGLYLIRTLLARQGGRLDVSPRDPQGTRVTLRLAEHRP